MKTNNAKQVNGRPTMDADYLAAKAAEAQKQADAARKRARAAKAKFKLARKAFKQAKKIAKQSRKEARIVAKALKTQVKTARKSAKIKIAARNRTRAKAEKARQAAPRIMVEKPVGPSVLIRSDSPGASGTGQSQGSRAGV